MKLTNELELTPDQKEAWKHILHFVRSKDKYFVLNGYAGTGKTTLMKLLVDNFNELQRAYAAFSIKPMDSLVFTATTNKAVTVLQHFLKRSCSTIHSLLGLFPGKCGLEKKRPTQVTNSLVVVDESSMIDWELMQHIEQSSNRYIFVGDDTQLPPVAGSFAVFNKSYPEYKMTQVIRQKPGVLFELIKQLRRRVEGYEVPELNIDGKEIIWGKKKDFNTTMFEDFSHPDWRYADSKYIGFTNNRVQAVNHMIEEFKHGQYNIHVGDWMINNRWCKYRSLHELVIFTTDQMVMIEDVHPAESFMDMTLYPVKVKGIWLRIPSHLRAFNIAGLDDLIDLRNMYACTVHKAQGSTFDRVYINLNDIGMARRKNEDMFWRLLYVAVSRAREQVIFTGSL